MVWRWSAPARRSYAGIFGTSNGLAMHMERLGHPYYHSRSQGGEGHLEVAKNIYYSAKKLCHMVLSLKPFGCMPSTQSDGAQAAVVSQYRDMIFLPIETSGGGEVIAHSRVQMALGRASVKARKEMADVLRTTRWALGATNPTGSHTPARRTRGASGPSRRSVTRSRS